MDEYEYTDSDRLDEMNTAEDYNRWEEEQVARDMDMGEGDPEEDFPESDGEMEDQLLDMMMEDRIGGTGVEDFESWGGDSDGSVGCD